MRALKISGVLYFFTGSIALLGIITTEAMYPDVYITYLNGMIDFEPTTPSNSIIHQPSTSIFNFSMVFAGFMCLNASLHQHIYFKKWLFTVPIILFSIALIGIGLFSGNKSYYHGMSSLLAFLSGAVAAIFAFKIISSPYKFISIAFGVIALSTWFIVAFVPDFIVPSIGLGGAERWIVYPIMLWVTGLGGYLMSNKTG